MRQHWIVSLMLSLAAMPAAAMSDTGDDQDLSGLSIEELAQLPVRSASKHEQPLSEAPTALYVVTGEAIERSDATSLPEALRLAPNLHVERINATQYAISARGFNGYEASNKLLVLIDGRSVYSTLHSGVFWELRSPLLEDIEQIEVISGPGGTLFGPNAVNGVINVMSKPAEDTLGALARGTAGANERTAGVRYGARLGPDAAIRVSANYFDRENMPSGTAADVDDGIRGWQANLRADLGGEDNRVSLIGDIFDNQTFLVPGDGNHGHSILGRWNQALSGVSSFQLQAYYDYFERRATQTIDRLENVDVEAQYNLNTDRHDLVIGGGVRTARDEFMNDFNAFQLDPQRDRIWIGNMFAQDRFAISQAISATAGVKVESSSFTGLQVLPNLRLAWQPTPRALFWASASRAVRTPSRVDRDLASPGVLVTAPGFQSEKLVALEAGYRGQPTHNTTISLSLFYNLYDDLRSAAPLTTGWPVQLRNAIQGTTWGFEAWATQQLLPWWRLSGGAAVLRKDFEVEPGQTDITRAASIGRDPGYRLSLRSQMDLPHGLRLDAGLRAVDDLIDPATKGYIEADARLGWMATDRIELFVAGDNLLHRSHLESNDLNRAQPVQRSVFAGARLRF